MGEVIRIVSATRVSADRFDTGTLLGRSLAVLRRHGDFETDIAYENRDGLPTVYNRAIERAKDNPATLVFVHDDVYIADTLWADEIRRCLGLTDVIGVAGNRRRVPNQPAWAFLQVGNGNATWDAPQNLSGIVGHGEPPGAFTIYGPPYQACQLLDGLLLAVRSETMHRAGLAFDPLFKFHFYDMDFCQQAELKKLKMGTAFIKLVHRSGGAFGSPPWAAAYHAYLDKYGG